MELRLEVGKSYRYQSYKGSPRDGDILKILREDGTSPMPMIGEYGTAWTIDGKLMGSATEVLGQLYNIAEGE